MIEFPNVGGKKNHFGMVVAFFGMVVAYFGTDVANFGIGVVWVSFFRQTFALFHTVADFY